MDGAQFVSNFECQGHRIVAYTDALHVRPHSMLAQLCSEQFNQTQF